MRILVVVDEVALVDVLEEEEEEEAPGLVGAGADGKF